MASYHILESLLPIAFLLSTNFRASFAQFGNSTQPEVTILQGTLLGTTLTTRLGRNVSAFMGIPFAQPPTGNLRFANPVAADGWNGTLDAVAEASVCPQISSTVIVGDEDCLYLNVFTPQLSEDAIPPLLPVMVFVHGGAFQTQGSTSLGSPDYLLDSDVLLVTFHYRIGPLGFLSTGDEVASGNWGLKDQVLALQWVQNNIRYFGGDPDQVTIFGVSAGACSIHLLTLSNTTNGLFHKYVTQSGSALAPWAHRPRTAYSSKAFELGDFVGCSNDTSDSLISCLRTVDFSDIIATKSQFVVWEFLPDIMWGPTDEPDIEGALLTDTPANLFAAGKVRDLPWISGTVRDEGLMQSSALYEDDEMFHDWLENIDTLLPVMFSWTYQSDSGAAWTKAVKSYYFNDDLTSNSTELLKNLTILIGDALFYYPAYNALQQQRTLAVNPQYFYSFNYLGTYSYCYDNGGDSVIRGITHGEETRYLFPRVVSNTNSTMSETDYEIVDAMAQLWTFFAINGTPTASALGDATWARYSLEDNYLGIGNDFETVLEVQYSFFKERMEFWANMYAATESKAESSGIVTWNKNLPILLLVACSKFVLSAATVDRLG